MLLRTPRHANADGKTPPSSVPDVCLHLKYRLTPLVDTSYRPANHTSYSRRRQLDITSTIRTAEYLVVTSKLDSEPYIDRPDAACQRLRRSQGRAPGESGLFSPCGCHCSSRPAAAGRPVQELARLRVRCTLPPGPARLCTGRGTARPPVCSSDSGSASGRGSAFRSVLPSFRSSV